MGVFSDVIRSACEPMAPAPTETEPRLTPLEGIQSVVFDVYGTLLISGSGDVGLTASADRATCFHDAVADCGVDWQSDPQDIVERLDAIIQGVHAASRQGGVAFPEVDIVKIWQTVLASVPKASRFDGWTKSDWELFSLKYELRVNPVWPMPGALETLTALNERSTILGIVSNAQFFTPPILETLFDQSLDSLGLRSELNYFSYEHLQAKPGSYLFEQLGTALEKHGIETNQALYVGNDMLNDVVAAAKVGFRTALFAGDRRSLRWREDDERVRNVEPDIVITELPQLASCLV